MMDVVKIYITQSQLENAAPTVNSNGSDIFAGSICGFCFLPSLLIEANQFVHIILIMLREPPSWL